LFSGKSIKTAPIRANKPGGESSKVRGRISRGEHARRQTSQGAKRQKGAKKPDTGLRGPTSKETGGVRTGGRKAGTEEGA